MDSFFGLGRGEALLELSNSETWNKVYLYKGYHGPGLKQYKKMNRF